MIVELTAARNLLWILCNSAIVNAVQVVCFLFVRPFNTALYRRCMSTLQTLLLDVFATCFPPTHLQVTGELPSDPTRPVILLANHQVDADWWFIWQAIHLQRAAGNVKIVLKQQLKLVPILGWGMRFFEFLFLHRRIDQDAPRIQRYMQSLTNDGFPFWLVLFPEGTTIHTEYVTKSLEFAEAKGRPKLQHVMLPRTTGLQVILDAVADEKPDIYDLTLAYPTYSGEIPTAEMGYSRHHDTGVPSMKSLLAGEMPGVVSMRVQKHAFDDVYSDVERFLDTTWQAKDADLAHYIQHHEFPIRNGDRQQTLHRKGSVISALRLWIGVAIVTFLLPFVTLSFFPAYTVWVIYCFIYALYDRTITQWLPYILDLVIKKATKAREQLQKRRH